MLYSKGPHKPTTPRSLTSEPRWKEVQEIVKIAKTIVKYLIVLWLYLPNADGSRPHKLAKFALT